MILKVYSKIPKYLKYTSSVWIEIVFSGHGMKTGNALKNKWFGYPIISTRAHTHTHRVSILKKNS